jgi:hypothetical protein
MGNAVDLCVAAGWHDRVKGDLRLWRRLHLIGVQEGCPGDAGVELRNCDRCDSTLGVEIAEERIDKLRRDAAKLRESVRRQRLQKSAA